MLCRLVFLGLFVLSAGQACKEDGGPAVEREANFAADNQISSQQNSARVSGQATEAAGTGASEDSPKRLDPRVVRASLAKLVALAPSGIHPSFQVPEVRVQKKDADYVKIMRCRDTYILRNSVGYSMDQIRDSFNKYDDLKDMWALALNDRHECRLVNERMSGEKYLDIAAKTGSFYYVINPCLSAKRSITGREECSFNLQMSSPLSYTNQFLDKIQSLSIDLAKAEAALNTELDEMSTLARLLELRLRACENSLARENTLRSFYRGLVSLGLFGSGVILFERWGILANLGSPWLKATIAGPNSSVMVGFMAMQIGSMFIQPALGITEQMNTCLSGFSKNMKAQFKGQPASVWKQFKKDAKGLEKSFNVKNTVNQLLAITKVDPQDRSRNEQEDPYKPLPGDGTIKRKQLAIFKILAEMDGYDQAIVSGEELITEAAKKGLDVQDASGLLDMLGGGGGGGGGGL